ncbi:MAG: tRNA (cytidine(34)-2'-O)-methyltransferase [Pirellulaceae bacterium]|nr:tRNA (cytidine(34)-2'-O)-methyltransferase [Pirellulaceae bacterium]
MSDEPYLPKIHLVLYQPEIPHNTGALGRTCVALGAKLWLVQPLGFQLTTRQLKRAGLDYWQYLNWEMVPSWNHLIKELPEQARYFYFTKKGKTRYDTVNYQVGDVLVFGSETSGLPDSFTQREENKTLYLPMKSEVRSLNLAVSASIAGYEAVRQIGF